jgi:NAD(P)-dependent dehydrogenase (short-subunit alcohol dehydrogenase family)
MNTDFSGKVVLVAGGTGGLGRAISLAFLAREANVAVTWRHENEFLVLESAAADRNSHLAGFNCDVTDPRATVGLIDQVLARFNRLDVLVNAVGGYAGGIPLWQLEPEVFERMFDLNLRASYALAKAAASVMIARKSGAIVNVAAKAAWDHAAGASAYAGTGVRANSILPSIIDTEANRRAMPKADFSKWPKAEDIANVVLFLASDSARVIHGASIPVFGNG